MTHEHAFLIVDRLWFMFAMCGLILFASNAASTKSAERIRKTSRKKKAKTAGAGQRPGKKILKVKRGLINSPKTKTKKRPLSKVAPSLSQSDQRRVDDYFIRRDNITPFSNMPL